MILTQDEFFLLRTFVKNTTGIDVSESQKKSIEYKIEKRIDEIGLLSFKEYYLRIITGLETAVLTSIVTVHETYFYRNSHQLEGFSLFVLPKIIEEKQRKGEAFLNVLSAGCSSGEEPYTLAMILKEVVPSNWEIKINAVDIDDKIVSQARSGLYSKRSIRDVPPHILNKYFTQKATDESEIFWQVAENIRSMVDFHTLNLLDGMAIRQFTHLDILFCRNVLIYFEEYHQKKLVNYFYNMLNPGGFIFLGHSEMLGLISGAFKIEKFENYICYRR